MGRLTYPEKMQKPSGSFRERIKMTLTILYGQFDFLFGQYISTCVFYQNFEWHAIRWVEKYVVTFIKLALKFGELK